MTISTTTLKNAAFAIEHDLWTDPSGANYLVKDGAILRRWEPADNDGDALRLAVCISGLNLQWVIAEAWQAHDSMESRNAHVRESIVNIAAQIGAAICQS